MGNSYKGGKGKRKGELNEWKSDKFYICFIIMITKQKNIIFFSGRFLPLTNKE